MLNSTIIELTIGKIFFFNKCADPKGPLNFECRPVNLLLFGLLGEKDSLDVGEDTSLGDGDSGQQFV